jgi:hypothetical protein
MQLFRNLRLAARLAIGFGTLAAEHLQQVVGRFTLA